MKKGAVVISGVWVALVMGLMLVPAPAEANRLHAGSAGSPGVSTRSPGVVVGSAGIARPGMITRPGGFAHPGGGGRRVPVHPGVHFAPRPFFPRPFVRPFFPYAVITSPAIVYAAPYGYYGAPAYDSAPYPPPASYYPPPAYQPSTGYAAPPPGTPSVAPSPTPSVIEFPNGRYELRGDGMTTPYTWVWIPNPPSAPPPPTAPQSSATPAPSRNTQTYRWTDEQGVVHWTDRLETVPLRYRQQAKQNSST